MATITLIGEPFPDLDAAAHAAAARDLAAAIARVAPRGWGARVLVARDDEVQREAPRDEHERNAEIHTLPMNASMLPAIWRSGVTARPLDGEFVHALTPLAPLRARREEDGSQTSVLVPHTLAWDYPEFMGSSAKLYRRYVKRAFKLADAVLAPTHATAGTLQRRFGMSAPIRVVPLAAPAEYLEQADSAERRSALGLPGRYFVTFAPTGSPGRLETLFEFLVADADAPALVVVTGASSAERIREAAPETIRDRVITLAPTALEDVGAIISGATALLCPQALIGAGYEVIAAVQAGVPVIAACDVANELALDAGLRAETAEEFARAWASIDTDEKTLERLRIIAADRAKAFSWNDIAWQLWEIHAGL